MDICNSWIEFVKKHSKIKPYAHFDKRVSLEMPSIREYVLNTEKIASHSFYPFIHFVKTSSRYGKDRKIKTRNLYYCSHLDRCVYQRYSFLLNYEYNIHVAQEGINEASIAYRDILNKNNIDFAKEAFDTIKEYGYCTIMIGDFTDFFDSLEHNYLKSAICNLLGVDRLPKDYYAIFKNITQFAFWDWKKLIEATGHNVKERGIRKIMNDQVVLMSKEEFRQNKLYITKNSLHMGIPQGSPISAVLSNIYMIEFDKMINKYVTDNNGKYLRYSDDFIIILPVYNQRNVEHHEDFVTSCVDRIPKLNLQKDKTNWFIYKHGSLKDYTSNSQTKIDYLGFIFDGSRIRIRPKSITKYYYRMRRKAKTIGRMNWISPNNKRITARKLYEIYSKNKNHQTFINYAMKSSNLLNLEDPEASALIKNHKRKIRQAIKAGLRNSEDTSK